jgi:hypothetical protein
MKQHSLLSEVYDSIYRMKNVWFERKNRSTLKLSKQVGSDIVLRDMPQIFRTALRIVAALYNVHPCLFFYFLNSLSSHFISDSYIASSVPYNRTSSIVSYNNQNT